MDKKTSKQIPIGGIIDKPKTSLLNKTGDWKSMRPQIDESKCIHCVKCVLACPENCIAIKKDGKRGDVNLDFCKGCGICAKECPVGAITMVENK